MNHAMRAFEELESEVRVYIRSFNAVFQRARGSVIFDEHGHRYIDFFSGAGSVNYGHNHPLLKERLIDYVRDDGIVQGLDMATVAKRHFLETFERLILIPRGMRYKLQFTGPTGTNAVEAALKIARNVTGRSNVVAFTNSFHGMSLGSLAVTGNARYRRAAGLALGGATFVPYDGYGIDAINSIAYLRRLLTDNSSGLDLPAAIIVETVQADGGVNVASRAWLIQLHEICKEFNVLLIVDDIQVGCGRAGHFFSFEGMGFLPDIVVLSKSLSGYGLPMSMVLLRPDLDVWKPGEHTGTFRGNNPAFVTAAYALELFWQNQRLETEIAVQSKILSEGLNQIADCSPEARAAVRGRGLIFGLDCGVPGLAGEISRIAFEQGLIIETCGANGQVLKCLPPLVIEPALLRQGLDIIANAVCQAVRGLGDMKQHSHEFQPESIVASGSRN